MRIFRFSKTSMLTNLSLSRTWLSLQISSKPLVALFKCIKKSTSISWNSSIVSCKPVPLSNKPWKVFGSLFPQSPMLNLSSKKGEKKRMKLGGKERKPKNNSSRRMPSRRPLISTMCRRRPCLRGMGSDKRTQMCVSYTWTLTTSTICCTKSQLIACFRLAVSKEWLMRTSTL